MKPPLALGKYGGPVQAELQDAFGGLEGPLYTMMRYHLGWVDRDGRPQQADSGKGLRSTVCLLAYEAVGGEGAMGLPAAAAVELVHAFSLVHDDIQDRSPERHHRPTVWAIWGEAQAINAGDALFTLARLTLLRLLGHGVSPAVVTHLAGVMDRTCLRLCEGQQRDLALQDRYQAVSPDEYFEMIEGKTAALMGAACRIGGRLGTESETMVDHLAEAGRRMGLAFQVRDDFLGIWGVASEMGKPVMEDVWVRKKSLPIVYGLEHATGRDRKRLLDIFSGPPLSDRREVEDVVTLLEHLGAKAFCQEVAASHAAGALDAIDASGCSNEAAGQLKELARFAAERDF